MARLTRNRKSARLNGAGLIAFGALFFWISYDAHLRHKVIRTGWGASWMSPEVGVAMALIFFILGGMLLVSSFIRRGSNSE